LSSSLEFISSTFEISSAKDTELARDVECEGIEGGDGGDGGAVDTMRCSALNLNTCVI
jgi:hypothetical protein